MDLKMERRVTGEAESVVQKIGNELREGLAADGAGSKLFCFFLLHAISASVAMLTTELSHHPFFP